MNTCIYDKIKYIVDKFNSDKKIRPKLWNMDTDIISIIKRFRENLIKNNLHDFDHITIIKSDYKNKSGNDLYSIIINNVNVTPISYKSKVAAERTLIQYLQTFSSFGWVFFDEKHIKIIKNNSSTRLDVSSSISSLLSHEFNMNDNLINLIINGTKSYVPHTKNLSYSLFVFYCFSNGYKFTNKLKIMFEKIKGMDDIKNFYSDDPYSNHYILGEKMNTKHDGNLSQTYKSCLLELSIKPFYENITDIYLSIINPKNED